jgi:hypothetical protein
VDQQAKRPNVNLTTEKRERELLYVPIPQLRMGIRSETVVVSEGTAEVGSNMSNRSSTSLWCLFLSLSFEELGYERPDNSLMSSDDVNSGCNLMIMKYGRSVSLSRAHLRFDLVEVS